MVRSMTEVGGARGGLSASFGPLELAVLETVWAGGELDVAGCVKRLGSGQAHETVKTVMERLVRKGYLDRRKQSRAYVYWATRGRAAVEAEQAAAGARRLVDGFGDLAVANFVKAVQDDAGQVEQLRALLAQIADRDTSGPAEGGGPR